jgi:hypothetical protein
MKYLLDHFRHSKQRAFLDSLCCTDDHRLRLDVRAHLLEQCSAVLRGHDADDDFGRLENKIEIVAG